MNRRGEIGKKSRPEREKVVNCGGEKIGRAFSAMRQKEEEKRTEKNEVNTMKRSLVKYVALPEYLQDNEFILDYYRCEWSLKDTFLSVFSWHNETLNIWTHLGGFLIFAAMTVASLTENTIGKGPISSFFRTSVVATPLMAMLAFDLNKGSRNASPCAHVRRFPKSSLLDINGDDSEVIPMWPWLVFLGGVMCCLIFSSVSHLLACHSKRLNLFFWRLDYAGISIMIVCSFFAPIYYVFYCQHFWRVLYLSSIFIIGILAIITLLAPSLSSPQFRGFRACLFLALGFSGVIPAVHAAALQWGYPQVLVALGFEVLMAILYATGAGFYVSRIPERWKPGAFDLTGHSHQIFHVFVVGGALAHSAAILIVLHWRSGLPSC